MKNLKSIAHNSLELIQDAGLFIIAIATVIAIGIEVKLMITQAAVTLADLLLLFIYLEVLAMVSIYLKSGKLPIRIPIYIAIVALARYLILDMKNLDTLKLLGITGAVLGIAIAVLIIRYGHTRYPYE